MSILKENDAMHTALRLENETADIREVLHGKQSPGQLSQKEKDSVSKLFRDRFKNRTRLLYNLSVDHQKYVSCDFVDAWSGDISSSGLQMARRGMRSEEDAGNKYSVISLTPAEMTTFVNMKGRYMYFKINKISATFVSNSAMNLTPITCKYLPPLGREESETEIDQITKFAESYGTTEGYISVHNPFYLLKNVDKNGKVTSVNPVLYDNMMLCNYSKSVRPDYGKLIFECKNVLQENSVQTFLVRVTYNIDFYSGIDYDNIPIEIEPDDKPDNGEESGEEEESGDEKPEPKPVPSARPCGRVRGTK